MSEPVPDSQFPRWSNHFDGELTKLINRFCSEFDISYSEIIGSLELKKYQLMKEMKGEDK